MACGTGKYTLNTTNTGSEDCLDCMAGKYSALAVSDTQAHCLMCEVNEFSAPAAEVCSECPEHSSSPAGSAVAGDCQCNGGYTGTNGQACSACVPGKYKVGLGSGECMKCPSNTYSGGSAQSQLEQCLACPAESTANGTGNTRIDECLCDKGSYQDTPEGGSQWVCESCEVGTYGNAMAAEACQQCPSGTYLNFIGATRVDQCISCPLSSNSPAGTGSIQQCMCDAGYSGSSADTCVECTTGKYNADSRASPAVCTLCDAGKINPDAAATSENACETCEAGTYASETRALCMVCPVNTYCVGGLQKQCVGDFRANTHNENGGGVSADTCVCKQGMFLYEDTCTPCDIGSYCNGVANSITKCPTHSTSLISSEQGAISDCICKAGFSGEDGQACDPCGPGTFKTLTGDSLCIVCGAGRFSPYSARSIDACEDCALGKFSTLLATAGCTGCAKGTYSEESAQTVCQQCSPGTWSNTVNASNEETCTQCGAGKYQMSPGAVGENACKVCPVGKFSFVAASVEP